MSRTYLATVLTVAMTLFVGPAMGGAILPGIGGVVFQDADMSGGPSAGEGISGATLRLYQDDGDGIFDPSSGDTQIGPDFVTGVDGRYDFQSLDSQAKFFVQRATLDVGGTIIPGDVSNLLNPGEIRLLIDAFDNNQGVKANPIAPAATSTLNDPTSSVLGDERDVYVRLIGGIGEVELRSNAFGVAVLQFDNSSGVVGEAIVTWDGVDMSANPIPSLGLGDIDLTEGGVNEGIFFRLGVDLTGADETLLFRIYDESTTEFSQAVISFPVTDGTASAAAFMSFSDLIGPVSPGKVNAIQLIMGQGAKSIDAQLDIVGAMAPVVQDFVVVPEPSTMLMSLIGLLSFVGGRRYVSRNRDASSDRLDG